MPILVAAAGAGLGAWAAGALNKEFGAGAGQPIQIDPSETMDMIQQGTDANNYYDELGLSTYNDSITQARQDLQQGVANSIATLQPSSQASQDAINQMMQFMGMDPISATANIGTQLQGIPGIGDTSNIQTLINEANSARDPAQRAQLSQQVVQAIQNAPITNNLSADLASQAMPTYAYANATGIDPKTGQVIVPNAAGENPATGMPIINAGPQPQTNVPEVSGGKALQTYNQGLDESARQDMINEANSTYQDELAVWKAQQAQTTTTDDAAYQAAVTSRNNLAEQFSSEYTPTYQAGYTGAQATQALENTPGYQFTLNQGSAAISASAAAQGMLGSGNTLSALTQYGQNLGLQYFNSHMQNLASIANSGASATSQIATNQANLGGGLSQLDTLQGNTANATYTNMGQVANTNLNSEAQTAYNADVYNTNVLLKQQAQQASLQQQGVASGAGYLSAGTAQQQFNYQMAQNQQGGQAYLGNPGTTT